MRNTRGERDVAILSPLRGVTVFEKGWSNIHYSRNDGTGQPDSDGRQRDDRCALKLDWWPVLLKLTGSG